MGTTIWPTPGAIRLRQSGIISIVGGTSSSTITISPVNVNKCQLSMLGQTVAGGFGELARLTLTSSTQITCQRQGTTGSTDVSWELIERY